MSGTIFISDNETAREILATWEKKCLEILEGAGVDGDIPYELTDQFLLHDALFQHLGKDPSGVVFLAQALCYVQNKNPDSKGVKPIIEHLQASREMSTWSKAWMRRRARILVLSLLALVRRRRTPAFTSNSPQH